MEIKSGILILEAKIKNKKIIIRIIKEKCVINMAFSNFQNIKLIDLKNCEIKTTERGLYFSSTDLLIKRLARIDELEKLFLMRDINKSD